MENNDLDRELEYQDPVWYCRCGNTAERQAEGWIFTDTAWCPECKWLA